MKMGVVGDGMERREEGRGDSGMLHGWMDVWRIGRRWLRELFIAYLS